MDKKSPREPTFVRCGGGRPRWAERERATEQHGASLTGFYLSTRCSARLVKRFLSDQAGYLQSSVARVCSCPKLSGREAGLRLQWLPT